MSRTTPASRKAAAVAAAAVVLAGVVFRGVAGISVPSQRVHAAADVQGQWASVGPSPVTRNAGGQSGPENPFSGRIGSIAVDPTNLNHWLLGVGNGGVWESRDGGSNWLPLTDAAPTLATGDITFDPTNPQVVYVGTGEAHGGNLAMGGAGILKSSDGLRTWTVVGAASFAKGAVRRLRVNPANANELVAASTRGGFGRQAQDNPNVPPPYGVLRSTDAGQTWVRTLAGQATALEIDPANFNRQYAAIGEHVSGQDAGVEANGLYRSKDAGQHWDAITGPWGASTGRIELALAPSNPNIVYASVSQPDGTRILGLFRTDNAWDDPPTWRQISIAQTNGGIAIGAPGTYTVLGNYSHVISVNPSDPNMVFAGGKGSIWRCTNCGSAPQWTSVGESAKTDLFADEQALAWAGGRLILGNDGGVFSTTDLGASWQNHNASISTTMFYTGALHPTDPGFMIGGTRDHGEVVRRDGSFKWVAPPNTNGTGAWGEGEIAISSRHPETDWMIGSFATFGIYRTTDGARTVVRADPSIDRSSGGPLIIPARKCPANDDVFLTGSDRLWRTDDFFNSSLPSWSLNGPSGAGTTSGSIFAITFLPSDTNCGTYAYGTRSGEIRLTRDGGKTWTDLSPTNPRTLPLRTINSIAFDPATSDTVYVALSNYNPAPGAGRPGHIYKTTNAHSDVQTWVNVGPADDVPFNVVEVDPRNASLVYAGSDSGLWVSGDAGATWQKIGPDRGLPYAAIYDIKINPATDQTVVFTHGRGAFRLVK